MSGHASGVEDGLAHPQTREEPTLHDPAASAGPEQRADQGQGWRFPARETRALPGVRKARCLAAQGRRADERPAAWN